MSRRKKRKSTLKPWDLSPDDPNYAPNPDQTQWFKEGVFQVSWNDDYTDAGNYSDYDGEGHIRTVVPMYLAKQLACGFYKTGFGQARGDFVGMLNVFAAYIEVEDPPPQPDDDPVTAAYVNGRRSVFDYLKGYVSQWQDTVANASEATDALTWRDMNGGGFPDGFFFFTDYYKIRRLKNDDFAQTG